MSLSLRCKVLPISAVPAFADLVYSKRGRIVSIIPHYLQVGDRREVWYEIPVNEEDNITAKDLHDTQGTKCIKDTKDTK